MTEIIVLRRKILRRIFPESIVLRRIILRRIFNCFKEDIFGKDSSKVYNVEEDIQLF